MKKMYGTIAVVVGATVLLTVGSALAWGGWGGRQAGGQGMMNWQNAQAWCREAPGQGSINPGMAGPMGNSRMMGGRGNFGNNCPAADRQMMGWRGNFGNSDRMGMWTSVEIPQEIRDKQTEMAKLSLEMRNEMSKRPIDRTKIEELYKKSVELRNELSGWRMQQNLDMVEKLQK
ncbi:hypothetical protein [Aminivibrio sp.]|jgi:ribosomal protein L29|uniref:hypothetical protein n=1 Tax=Aminivibrio sp. TaxID=1872489 RepID=UPI001A3C91DB|nr:hypothetical protein [Aminivibrio sp.]MBL3538991.1 hypothetical protein [Aminivibrio sp.]MDK2958905.1 hypothetical protein [Synergistaceae bacterium]